MTATLEPAPAPSTLEPDNATRIAIFDAMSEAAADRGEAPLTLDELYGRVIGRLRVLVPRELHVAGERAYLAEKVEVCLGAGLLARVDGADDQFKITGAQPWVRYPDDEIQPYPPGLIAARERLDAVNNALRRAGFDVRTLVPHHGPASPTYQALVASMREHGFLRQFAIFRFPDGNFVDGDARVRAAADAGEEVKWLDLEKLGEPEATKARRRDTPLNRVLLALDSNVARLTEEDVQHIQGEVATVVGRDWTEIALDLERTREWRQAISPSYTPTFSVTPLGFEDDPNRQVLVTVDHKIQMRSLVRAAGLPEHAVDKQLKYWVHPERARISGAHRPALFAHATDLISGIEAMLADRRERKRKAVREWEEILNWLRAYVKAEQVNGDGTNGR